MVLIESYSAATRSYGQDELTTNENENTVAEDKLPLCQDEHSPTAKYLSIIQE